MLEILRQWWRGRGFYYLPGVRAHSELLPQRATFGSAGYDIRANELVVIPPGQKAVVKTGLTAYMPYWYFLDLRIRSGLAYKYNLTLQNDAGVIDSDYEGKEIGVMIRNEGTEEFAIFPGDRIAQGIFIKYGKIKKDRPLDFLRRGGFGHTGRK
jgi:dUTP pyrophosphatase